MPVMLWLAISPESRRIRTLLSGKTTQPVGFRPYFLNPPVQCVTTVRGGAVAPEPPVVLMRKRLKSEVTVTFHPTRRYTAFQRQNECRRFNGDET